MGNSRYTGQCLPTFNSHPLSPLSGIVCLEDRKADEQYFPESENPKLAQVLTGRVSDSPFPIPTPPLRDGTVMYVCKGSINRVQSAFQIGNGVNSFPLPFKTSVVHRHC